VASASTSYDTWLSGSHYSGGTPSTHDGSETTTYNGTSTVNGEWIQLELPQKIKLSYYSLKPQIEGANDIYNERMPGTGKILGSNDGTNWYLIHDHSLALSDYTRGSYTNVAINTSTNTKAYKYIRFVIETTAGTENIAGIGDMKLYGHRENDLVRLPDPTNVLKYPHINSGISTATAVSYPAVSGINGLFGVHSIRGYVFKASSSIASYPVSSAFNGDTSSITGSRWASGATTYGTGGVYPNSGLAANRIRTLSSDLGGPVEGATGGTVKGEWLYIEMPYKVKATSMKIVSHPYVGEQPKNIIIYGSNDLTAGWTIVDNTYVSTSIAVPLNATGKTWTVSTASNPVAYKYFALVTTKTDYTGGVVGLVVINDWQLYGTEEDISIPIQIGGGNIDKVANFRVYDKFIGEDQALEIWDAQKDEFGRAKSSMTLHKGRLGIGTTEPEGRLAVADEPHNLEEFPPRAGGFDGDEWYMEGHGTFKASASNYHDSTDYYPGRAFTKSLVVNFGYASTSSSTLARWSGNSGLPNQSSSDPVGSFQGHQGDWIELELPYRIRVKSFQIQTRLTTNSPGDHPKNGFLYGSNNRENWTQVTEFTNLSYTPSQLDGIGGQKAIWNIDSETGFKYLRLLTTQKIDGSAAWLMISELKYFGTREQGQSVLHDGQLTLTKNLTVPRIGPALDADDTPRRDRLVVEYNTSTNPTFEGAVRDTSGRGNDGVFYGGASYDATEKAWTNTTQYGTGDYVYTKTHLTSGDFPFAMSFWVKMTQAYNGIMTMVMLGSNATNKGMAIDIYNAGNIYWYGYDGSALLWNTAGTNQTSDIFPIGKWVHVVAVHHQGSGAATDDVYINGEIMPGTPTVTNPTGTNVINFNDNPDLVIGARGVNASSASNDFCPASYSNFKLYDTALTAEEVKTLYDMGRTGSVANPQPLHIAAPLYSPGTIVQVDQVFTNNLGISTTSTSPIDITGLSITIQPKFANSKILVSYQLAIGSNYHAFVHIKRTQNGVTSYDVGRGAGSGFRQRASSYVSHLNSSHVCSENMEFLDSANGIDPITYQIQMWVASSSYIFILNRSISYGNSEYFATLGSSLTVKEICQ
jgi:hypothetical protein